MAQWISTSETARAHHLAHADAVAQAVKEKRALGMLPSRRDRRAAWRSSRGAFKLGKRRERTAAWRAQWGVM